MLHGDNDLPAVIQPDRKQEWYQNGKRHRDNLPAIIWPDGINRKGSQEWYQHGRQLHVER